MDIKDIPFQVIDWDNLKPEEHNGIKGKALWKVFNQGNLRFRIVEYTQGYIADHWCSKGHAVFVLEGEFTSELKDGRKFTLKKGMSYVVADNTDPHRSSTISGVKLLIAD
jgi:quercetin dioxygenase-like cupin family protein